MVDCDHFAGKVHAMDQPTRPTQLFILPGSVSKYLMDYKGGDHKTADQVAYGSSS